MCETYCPPGNPPKAAPDAKEHLLRHVLGIGTAVGQRAREADDRHLMASDQIVKSLAAARGRLCDQLLVDVHSAMSLQPAVRRSPRLDLRPGFIPSEYPRAAAVHSRSKESTPL